MRQKYPQSAHNWNCSCTVFFLFGDSHSFFFRFSCSALNSEYCFVRRHRRYMALIFSQLLVQTGGFPRLGLVVMGDPAAQVQVPGTRSISTLTNRNRVRQFPLEFRINGAIYLCLRASVSCRLKLFWWLSGREVATMFSKSRVGSSEVISCT